MFPIIFGFMENKHTIPNQFFFNQANLFSPGLDGVEYQISIPIYPYGFIAYVLMRLCHTNTLAHVNSTTQKGCEKNTVLKKNNQKSKIHFPKISDFWPNAFFWIYLLRHWRSHLRFVDSR